MPSPDATPAAGGPPTAPALVNDVPSDERIAYVRESLDIESHEEPRFVAAVRARPVVAAGGALALAVAFVYLMQLLGIVIYGAILFSVFAVTQKGHVNTRKIITECLTDRALYVHDSASGDLRRTELEGITKCAFQGRTLDIITPDGRVSIEFPQEGYADAWNGFIRSRGTALVDTASLGGMPRIRQVSLPSSPARAPLVPGHPADDEDLFGDGAAEDVSFSPSRTGTPAGGAGPSVPGARTQAPSTAPRGRPAPAAPQTGAAPATAAGKVTPEVARKSIPLVKAKLDELEDKLLEESISEGEYERQRAKYERMLKGLEAVLSRGGG